MVDSVPEPREGQGADAEYALVEVMFVGIDINEEIRRLGHLIRLCD